MEKISEIYTGAANGSFEVGQLLFEEGDFRLYLTLDELGRNDSLLLIRKSEVKQLVDQSEYLTEISRRRELLNQKGLPDPFDLSAKVRQLKPDQAVESFLSMLPGQVVYFGLEGEDYQQWGYIDEISAGQVSFAAYPSGKYQPFTGEVAVSQLRRLAAFSGEWLLDNPKFKKDSPSESATENLCEVHLKEDPDSFAVGRRLCADGDFSLYLTIDEIGRDDSLLLVKKPVVDRVIDQSEYLQDISRCRRQLKEKGLADPFKAQSKAAEIKQMQDFWQLAAGQVVSFVMKDEEKPDYGVLKSKDGDALSFEQYSSGKYETFAGQINLDEVDRLEAFGGELTLESSNC
ncbi:Putative uncharacterized protein [Lactobacillus equicursoris 66c]|uniref:Uncharacterized protein n=1 Tax=Lactobacillus equicursoris 66c TaxID=872326 RepID=K0NXK2_9LACO|nr:hypothetical protein [Lactobacillus equicursoris]CCK84185.1 Putative uncharacterized protein [Lactobacillus equicursoris 66c]